MSDPDIVFYNTSINHDPQFANGKPSPAVTNDQRTDIFLNRPQDYDVSIVRFSISGYEIPLQIAPIVKNQPDINKTTYAFTLSYNGTSISKNVTYVQQNDISPIPVSPVGELQDNNAGYYNIYDYQSLLDMFNTTLNDIFIEFGPTFATAFPPFFVFDPVTSLISLYTNNASIPSYDVNVVQHIDIYFNDALTQLFRGFQYNNISLGVNQFYITNRQFTNIVIVNAISYINTSQQFVALGGWSSLQSIQLLTQMPINYEGAPPVNNTGINGTNRYQNSYSIAILNDYIPDLLESAGNFNTKFIYNADFVYRWFNIMSANPLKQFDLQLYWFDNNGQSYPILLQSGQTCTFKFMFKKKNKLTL